MAQETKKTDDFTKAVELAQSGKQNFILNASKIDANIFKDIVDISESFAEELTVIALQSGLIIRQMDASHVSMINIEIPESVWFKYKCTGPIVFALQIDKLKKLLKGVEKSDWLSITTETNGEAKISIEGAVAANFKLHIIDTQYKALPMPKLQASVNIEVSPSILNKLLERLQAISGSVGTFFMTAKKGSSDGSPKLILSAKGDSGEADFTLDTSNPNIFSIYVERETESEYSISYLKSIVSKLNVDKIKLSYMSRYPLQIDVSLGEIPITFFQAPTLSSVRKADAKEAEGKKAEEKKEDKPAKTTTPAAGQTP